MFPLEVIYPLKNHTAGEPGQTSGGSVTSEGSSAGFRPVPKKRTFFTRRTCFQSESNGQGLDAQVGTEGIVPVPRRSLQQGSSGSSNQSYPKTRDETPLKSAVPMSNQESQLTRPSSSTDETSKQPLCVVSQVSSNSSLERERKSPSAKTDGSVKSPLYNFNCKSSIKSLQLSLQMTTFAISDKQHTGEVMCPQRKTPHRREEKKIIRLKEG